MRRMIAMVLAALCLLPAGELVAQHYTMRTLTILGPDGSVAFACITQPFTGAAAFVPDPSYRSGTAVIVVPETGWRGFLDRRYPAPWYYAASADYAAGRTFTPAMRAFLQATGKTTTVGYEAEGTGFGAIGGNRVPINPARSEADLAQVDAAIGNCSLGGRPTGRWR